MRRFKVIVLTSLIIALLSGCGNQSSIEQNEYEKALLGKWAYAHDLDKTEAEFKESGAATFEGKKYTYSSDGTYIHFTDSSQDEWKLRYVQNEDKMYVYIQSTYTKDIPEYGEGIVGVWTCKEKNWTYEFTDKGTFMEDGALTGHYTVDEEAGTVKLMYEEALEDTVFYYQLEGDSLKIEYPWLMQRQSNG